MTSVFDAIVSPPLAPSNLKHLMDVIDEFVLSLNEKGLIGAEVHGEMVKYLRVYPRYRPNRGADILKLEVKPDGIQVHFKPVLTGSNPESLRNSLISFAKGESFQETLQSLREAAKWPVEAILDSESRAYVEVSAEEQEKLGKAGVGAELEIIIKRRDVNGNKALPDKCWKAQKESDSWRLFSAGIEADVMSFDPSTLKLTLKKL